MNDEKVLVDCNIDYYHAIERFAGNVELYHKYLRGFVCEDAYSRLQSAMSTSDYESAERAVHSLKGIAGNLGIIRVFDVSIAMLSAIRAQNEDKAKQIFISLISEYNTAVDAIKLFFDIQ